MSAFVIAALSCGHLWTMSEIKQTADGKPDEWFYCLEHKTVEQGPQCRAADRMGPYGSREEASHAMETARARNEEWGTDPRWNDDNGTGD
ncbi:hypothetical protein GCM10010331_22810 [Streptomyces xanthochromogenes]|nr:hypothetical protein GCM10010331_22810 [Streptomyces xanthochromogenes]